MQGIIVKGIAGFYYVKVENKVYQCKARGKFKKLGVVPTVGDLVEIQVLDDGDGVVNEILPRRNSFLRPPIANVDCMVVVIAAADPEPNFTI
jgi:ribosome biogenesis GTPase